ncbi:MAG TPA: hypothetical protein VE913_12550 [Longimicrobium sp.]|nr:hypothetical protein [Longimicrobium sp.]
MSAGSLDDFASELEARIGRPACVRPFVCDGSPLECRAMIVGSYPAVALDLDFWEFWEPGVGFRRDAWDARYREARKRLGKPAVSPTRERINRISEASGWGCCLESNVEPTPNRTGPHVLDFLLHSVRPAVVLAFGADARSYFARQWNVAREATDDFRPVSTPWGTVQLRMTSHLLMKKYDWAEDVGRVIAGIVG